jgi:SAM-dependent methyltransferase
MSSLSNNNSIFKHHCECCNSKSIQRLLIRDGLEYFSCKTCGHCLKVPVSSIESDFTNAQSTYFGHDSLLIGAKISALDREILLGRQRTISKILRPCGAVVEVGPGPGFLAEWLKGRGHKVTLVEYSPQIAAILSNRLGVKVETGPFESCCLNNNEAVAFFSFHVIEHVVNPMEHLSRGLKSVRPGGYGFIATPNSRSLQQRFLTSLSPNFDEAHLRVFSVESLRKYCVDAGWRVIQCETPEYSSEWMRVASKMLRKLRGENESSTAGKYSKILSSQYEGVINSFIFLTAPLRFLQSVFMGGNEVLIILQRPDPQEIDN